MKVLLPTHEIGAAGIGTVVRGLCASLPDALSESDELVLAGNCRPRIDSSNVRCLSDYGLVATRAGRLLFEQSVVALAARRVDLVHLANPRPLFASGTPFVLTIHDVFVLDRPDWYPASFTRFKRTMLSSVLERGPRAIACVSNYTKERLLAHYPDLEATSVDVIYSGLDPAPEYEPPAEPVEDPYFLTLATIEPRKNHLGLLEAFRLARARGLRLRWKVAGFEGYHSEWIVPALKASEGVEFLGQVSERQRERLFEHALFFALPSHAEGFGFTPLEAMSRGIPTLCSEGTAMDETIGDSALRIPSGDTEAWADALTFLERDPEERMRLRGLGLARARRFTWDRTAREYVDRYRRVVALR